MGINEKRWFSRWGLSDRTLWIVGIGLLLVAFAVFQQRPAAVRTPAGAAAAVRLQLALALLLAGGVPGATIAWLRRVIG